MLGMYINLSAILEWIKTETLDRKNFAVPFLETDRHEASLKLDRHNREILEKLCGEKRTETLMGIMFCLRKNYLDYFSGLVT